jgi:hypothetical protein
MAEKDESGNKVTAIRWEEKEYDIYGHLNYWR